MANIGTSKFQIKGLFQNPQLLYLIGKENLSIEETLQMKDCISFVIDSKMKCDFIKKYISKKIQEDSYKKDFLINPEKYNCNSKIVLHKKHPDTIMTLKPYYEDSDIVMMFSEANEELVIVEHFSVENCDFGTRKWHKGKCLESKKQNVYP